MDIPARIQRRTHAWRISAPGEKGVNGMLSVVPVPSLRAALSEPQFLLSLRRATRRWPRYDPCPCYFWDYPPFHSSFACHSFLTVLFSRKCAPAAMPLYLHALTSRSHSLLLFSLSPGWLPSSWPGTYQTFTAVKALLAEAVALAFFMNAACTPISAKTLTD